MRNRGNGKGGGIAACGLVPEEMGVSRKVLDEDYILQVALLDPAARGEVEKTCIEPFFDVDQGGHGPHGGRLPRRGAAGGPPAGRGPLLRPRQAGRAGAVRRGEGARRRFPSGRSKTSSSTRTRSRLNNQFYASLGDKRAFVLSHARNLIILKIVGFAEAAVQYYRMADTRAHVWIAHQRYPTKGRVWHPGGAHPFIGLNEALVHNGDFANYHSVSRVPGRAEHLPAVPDRHRGLGAAVRPVEPRLQAIRSSTSSRPWRRPRSSTSTGCRPRSSGSTGRSRRPTSTPRPTARGSSSSPAAWPRPKSVPAAGHHRHGHAPAAGLRLAGGRGLDRADLLGEAGDRRHAGQPGDRGPAVHARGRHLLERPRRQPHRRRGVPADRHARRQRQRRSAATANGNGKAAATGTTSSA